MGEDEMRNQSEVHKSLQGRLENARAERMLTELEMRHLRHACGAALNGVSSMATAKTNVGYGSAAPAYQRAEQTLSVNPSDELAASALGSPTNGNKIPPLQQLARRQASENSLTNTTNGDFTTASSFTGTSSASRLPTFVALPRSSPHVWRQTTYIGRPLGALVRQSPAASQACIERTNSNYRYLLSSSKGAFYEAHGFTRR